MPCEACLGNRQGLGRGRGMMEKQWSRVAQEIGKGSTLGCGTLYLNVRTEEVTLLGAGKVMSQSRFGRIKAEVIPHMPMAILFLFVKF